MDIDLKKAIELKSPDFFAKLPGFLVPAVLRFIEKITHVKEIQAFFDLHGRTKNLEFIDAKASKIGSHLRTMPAPPPYGVSSTV